jgi:Fungal specific transcription factor domain.
MSWFFRLPQYIEAYFEKFHPNLPALHQPTFDMTTTKLPLLQAIACIGSVCHCRDTGHRIGVALFDAGCKSLHEYVSVLRATLTFNKIKIDDTWGQD